MNGFQAKKDAPFVWDIPSLFQINQISEYREVERICESFEFCFAYETACGRIRAGFFSIIISVRAVAFGNLGAIG